MYRSQPERDLQRIFSTDTVIRPKSDRNNPLICRLCATLKKPYSFVNIRDPNLDLCTKLERCCQLYIPEEDCLPENVCEECVKSLQECYKFVMNVHEAQESLQTLFDNEDEMQNIDDVIPVCKIEVTDQIDNSSLDDDAILASDKETFEVHEIQYEDIPEDDIVTGDDQDHEQSELQVETEEMKQDDPGSPKEIQIQDTWLDYPWMCCVCTETYISVGDLKKHFDDQHTGSEFKYICTDCTKTFTMYNTLLNHIKTRHRTHLIYFCDVCSEYEPEPKKMAEHRATHDGEGETIILCPVCVKCFKTPNSLQMHSHCHKPDEQKLKHECDVCNKVFGSRPNLKAHQKIHTGQKEFVCSHCGKAFVQKANLEEHLLTHVNDTPYECQECGKKFKTPARLTKHMSIHTDFKPHQCEQCGRVFREKDTLRVHLRIHTGAMPYECEICRKRFRFKSVLTTHRHQHTGERPYSCLECNHHFTNWPNYNKHMKRRHGIDTSMSARKSLKGNVKPVGTSLNRKPYVVPIMASTTNPAMIGDEEGNAATTSRV